ncbi:hypothetical protein FRC12_003553 [Ceratobasidium sp. 428]|nr:hypothetical protein FRC12_003553 [Ceratobasidium sp. 428]
MAASISMPHVMPGFLRLTRSYGILPSLRVSDVNLPVIGIFPPYGSLYAFDSAISVTLRNKLAAPEPPVIKVSSYESVVKGPLVRISSPDD